MRVARGGALSSPSAGHENCTKSAAITAPANWALASLPRSLKPEEVEMLEDLIVSAHAQARGKAEAAMTEKMKAITGGLQLPPGMKLPF